MKLSLIAARSENGIIGHDLKIPWKAKGEQLLFKALTYNHWLLVGRKTFESMGLLPHRKLAVISRSIIRKPSQNLHFFTSIDEALTALSRQTDHVFIGGGSQVYQSVFDRADFLHLSTIHTYVEGNVHFPDIPATYQLIYSQFFESNINYTYEIWARR